MLMPRQWTLAELTRDAAQSRANFRVERLDEEPDEFRNHYRRFRPLVEDLVASLGGIAAGSESICAHVGDKDRWSALRYITAPPISSDDLATLANVKFDRGFASRRADVASATGILLQLVDPFRFPWLREARAPSEQEIEVAISSTSVMLAAQAIETHRRTTAKREQEAAVKAALVAAGMQEVPPLTTTTLATAPAPGRFCGETKFARTKADIVARMSDHRVMLIECKASNSEVNSYKRINHEAAGKARTWVERIGQDNVVPCAAISGVFKPSNLETAQENRLNIFWQFRLEDLTNYVLEAQNG